MRDTEDEVRNRMVAYWFNGEVLTQILDLLIEYKAFFVTSSFPCSSLFVVGISCLLLSCLGLLFDCRIPTKLKRNVYRTVIQLARFMILSVGQ